MEIEKHFKMSLFSVLTRISSPDHGNVSCGNQHALSGLSEFWQCSSEITDFNMRYCEYETHSCFLWTKCCDGGVTELKHSKEVSNVTSLMLCEMMTLTTLIVIVYHNHLNSLASRLLFFRSWFAVCWKSGSIRAVRL